MAASKKSGLQFRYGMCLNDSCERNKTKEVIEVPARKDFVCPVCGKPLRECPPPRTGFMEKYGKQLGIGVAALVVLGGGGFALSQMGGSEEKAPGEVDKVDTAKVDSVKVDTAVVKVDSVSKPVKPETEEKEESKTGPTTPQPVAPKGPSVSWGKYTGPANGLGGTIRVTKSYTLDLNGMDGDVLELSPGDEIQNTQFKNGQLRGGVWVHDGKRRFFNR